MSEVDEKEKANGEPLGVVSGPAVNLSEMPTVDVQRAERAAIAAETPLLNKTAKLKVTFMPMNVEYEIDANETVLHLAQRHDIHIQSVCKGLPSCAECRVCIKEGEHHVPPPSSKELSLIGTAHYIDRSRLSCQLRCYGNIVVDLSEQLEKANRIAKQPQGRASRKEGEVSHAVKGNIIEEFHDDSEPIVEIAPTEERPGHDHFYEEPKKNNRKGGGSGNRNNRNQRGGNGRNENRGQGGGGGQPGRQRDGRPPQQNRSAGGGGNPRPQHNRGGRGNANGGAPRPRPSQGGPQGQGNQGGNPGSSRPQPRKNPENIG
jgi:ferredoxin